MKGNTKLYLITLALAAILLVSLLGIYASADGAATPPNISAKAAVLYVPETGEFLYEKNADERLPMASTTKIMTALITLSECELSDTVIVDERAVGIEGSSAYLRAGDELSVEELLYALMLQSANDAAVALAYHISGNIEQFSALMNEKAQSLGLQNTSFANPHGLDANDHYTTASDLSKIAAAALEDPIFRNITSTYKRTFATEHRRRTYVNHNKLLLRIDGAIGVKTGYTKRCGRCLVGATERNGLTLISVTLDAPSDWSDHEMMIDYGYSLVEKILLAKTGDISYELSVVNGESDTLKVVNENELSIITENAKHEIDLEVRLPRFVCAPINQGDVLGVAILKLDGQCIATTKLIAQQNVKIKKQTGIFSRLFDK